MSTEQNKAVLRRWWQALNDKTALSIIEGVYASDYVLYDPSVPEPVRGLEGVRGFVSSIVTAFPDAYYKIEDMLAEGDKVSHRVTVQGTHLGVFNGIPATGKPVKLSIMVISRLADHKIAEEWELFDALGLLQQIGVIPSPGQ